MTRPPRGSGTGFNTLYTQRRRKRFILFWRRPRFSALPQGVFGALLAMGLSEVETDSHGAIAIGGTLRAQFPRDSLEIVRSLVLASGAFSQARFDRMLAAFDDPTFAYIDNAWIATRGRVPL